jgi:EmrB/QacA subfamily drug resistance transporter
LNAETTRKALLWIVATGFFMQALDSTIVNTALPSMAASLHESPLGMQAVVVSYSLTMAMITPASGWLADRFGMRLTYIASILLFVLGSVCCAGAQSLTMLVVARVIQGVGGSMLMPIGRLSLLRSVSADKYIAALALVSISGQVGPLLGPALGGWLVQTLTWHWIFLINVPIGIIGIWAVRRFMPVGQLDDVPAFDFMGFGLLSLCMVAVSLALDPPVTSHRALWCVGLLVLGVASALAYIPHARRRRSPLFRLGLFREPNFSVGLVGNLVARIGSSAVPFLLPLLLQLQLGYTPLHSGLMMIPAALAGILSKSWVSGLVKRFGYETFLLVNTMIVGASIVSFALITPQWPLWAQIIQLAIFGAANSIQYAAMNSVTLKDLSRADAGGGNSLFSMVQMLAMGMGATIGGGLVGLLSHELSGTAAAFRYTFIIVGLVTLASGAVFRWLDDTTPKVKADTPEETEAAAVVG